MSTVKVTNIQHPSATTPAITLDSAGAMTGSFPYPNRNLLYNGAMAVSQRSASVAGITSDGYYTADRWKALFVNSVGTWTQTVENDAPTGSGFQKSLKMLCTTAKSVVTTDLLGVTQQLEGQDLQRIAKGTASAQSLTLSFWVKSNVTGTYIAYLYDDTNSRHVSAAYTISASATWEKKTITFPADSTGAFANSNASALYVFFHLAAGASLQSGTLQTTWAAYNAANRAVGQVNVAAAQNNYWQVTGLQLETGAVATPFEFKSFGQELRECQRYYVSYGGSAAYEIIGTGIGVTSNLVSILMTLPTEMRAVPVLTTSGNFRVSNLVDSSPSVTSLSIQSPSSTKTVFVDAAVSSGSAGKVPFVLQPNNSTASRFGLSAEL